MYPDLESIFRYGFFEPLWSPYPPWHFKTTYESGPQI